jgi:hypothetical protein
MLWYISDDIRYYSNIKPEILLIAAETSSGIARIDSNWQTLALQGLWKRMAGAQ